MGLDTSHDCWHGPYSAFTRWRNAIARAAGYEIQPVKDDSGMSFDTAMIEWDAIERANPGCYMGEWNTEPDDPLVFLIAHSDCEGEIKPEHAARLADRLEELLPNLPGEPDGPFSVQMQTARFIRGLRAAAEAGEPVDFH